MEWLDRGLAVRDVHRGFLTTDPKWDGFRDDAGFTVLLEHCDFVSVPPKVEN